MIINHKLNNKHTKITMLIITLLASVCMLTTSLVNGSIAYGAEAPAGDENFNYNGYSATQLKKISECISGVIPASKCPAYEASSKDYYTETGGTVNHDNMPASGSIINTKIGWRKWADAAMKANSYDGVYGTLKIASSGGATGTTSSTSNEVSDVRFRLIGINQDNRADGKGKAGLTFQAIGYYSINSTYTTIGGWRDSQFRKDLNDNKSGIVYNAIESNDFKQNVTPVIKETNNAISKRFPLYENNYISNVSSTTIDKLWILSPSEMGMPVIKNYNKIYSWEDDPRDANVHYYDVNSSYRNTIKSGNDGSTASLWYAVFNYIYDDDTYQWWMLPAGSRRMSNGNQSYHNTDLYSYCSLLNSNNPSTNTLCDSMWYEAYFLRSASFKFAGFRSAMLPCFITSYLGYCSPHDSYRKNTYSVVLAFAF